MTHLQHSRKTNVPGPDQKWWCFWEVSESPANQTNRAETPQMGMEYLPTFTIP